MSKRIQNVMGRGLLYYTTLANGGLLLNGFNILRTAENSYGNECNAALTSELKDNLNTKKGNCFFFFQLKKTSKNISYRKSLVSKAELFCV